MILLPLWVCLLTAQASDVDLTKVLAGVEQRYNRARTLTVYFTEAYGVGSKAKRSESGLLHLRKPGRMRWEYTAPAGKLFVSDGKDFYFYSPSSNRVEKSKMKESEDMRAPLAFLLGKLDFSRDFKSYRVSPAPDGVRIVAFPKSDKLPYSQVDFVVAPDSRITRLIVTGQDQSILDFTFRDEKLNPPTDDRLFRFQAPPGAEVVDASQGDR